jgi:hypothetical protein
VLSTISGMAASCPRCYETTIARIQLPRYYLCAVVDREQCCGIFGSVAVGECGLHIGGAALGIYISLAAKYLLPLGKDNRDSNTKLGNGPPANVSIFF